MHFACTFIYIALKRVIRSLDCKNLIKLLLLHCSLSKKR